MSRFQKQIPVFFAAVLLVLMLWAPALARQPRLANVILTDTVDALRLYLAVEGPFPAGMEEAVHSGVPVTFSFSIRIDQSRGFWPDKRLVDIFLTHTVKYNTLKQTYTISRSWDPNTPVTVYSIEAARKLMTELDGIDIIARSRLKRETRYQVQARATLQQVTLPWHLHHVLFFLSWWDVETDWYTIEFIY